MKTAIVKALKSFAVSESQKEGGIGRILIGFLIFMMGLIFITPAISVTLPGVLAKSVLNGFGTGEAPEDYAIYSDIVAIYDAYIEKKRADINEKTEQLRIDHAHEVEFEIYKWDPEKEKLVPTGEFGSYTEYAQATIEDKIKRPEVRLLMAYVATKQYEEKKYKIDDKEAFKFLDTVMIDETSYVGWDPIYVTANYRILNAEDTAEVVFSTESEQEQFLLFYDNLAEIDK